MNCTQKISTKTYSMELKRICTEDMYTSFPGAFPNAPVFSQFPYILYSLLDVEVDELTL